MQSCGFSGIFCVGSQSTADRLREGGTVGNEKDNKEDEVDPLHPVNEPSIDRLTHQACVERLKSLSGDALAAEAQLHEERMLAMRPQQPD